jgi:hypothetical protein
VEATFESLKIKVDTVEAKVDTVESRVHLVEREVDSQRVSQMGMKDEMRTVSSEIAAINAKLTAAGPWVKFASVGVALAEILNVLKGFLH